MQIRIRQAAGGLWVHTLAALDGGWSVSLAVAKLHPDGSLDSAPAAITASLVLQNFLFGENL